MQKVLKLINWHSFTEGISNVVYWLPVIWKDRDYDQNYLLQILHKKLEKMERFYRGEYASSGNAAKVAEEIRIAKELTLRLIEDMYFIELVDNINVDEIFSISNGSFHLNEQHPQYEEWNKSGELSDKMRADDKEKLFQLMKSKIDTWWD